MRPLLLWPLLLQPQLQELQQPRRCWLRLLFRQPLLLWPQLLQQQLP